MRNNDHLLVSIMKIITTLTPAKQQQVFDRPSIKYADIVDFAKAEHPKVVQPLMDYLKLQARGSKEVAVSPYQGLLTSRTPDVNNEDPDQSPTQADFKANF